MRIAVIGATGRLGGAIARVATGRGHDVTGLGSADVDVTDAAAVNAAVTEYDAVVVSVKGPDRVVPRAAEAVLSAGTGRLLFVGGAGSLQTPSGQRLVDTPGFPAPLRQASLDQAEALEIFRRAAPGLAWSYLSPPPVPLVDGDPGDYRAEARDTPIVGDGAVTTGDLAAAAVDALEHGRFVRQRFTVGCS